MSNLKLYQFKAEELSDDDVHMNITEAADMCIDLV